MIYQFTNVLTGLIEQVDTEELANSRLAEIRVAYTSQEADRFCMVKVVAVGNDFAWSTADLVNDPEEGNYRVFIHATGLYESFTSLSAAKIKKQILIDEFMANCIQGNWITVEKSGVFVREFLPEGLKLEINTPSVSIMCVSNVYVRQMNFKKAGDKNNPHLHTHDHTTLLASGSVTCSVDGIVTIFKAPVMIYIVKDKMHFFTALEDNTVAYCVHAIRHEGGDNDIISAESVPAGVDIRSAGQLIQSFIVE